MLCGLLELAQCQSSVWTCCYTAATTTVAVPTVNWLTALSLLHYNLHTHTLYSAAESDDISLVVQCAKKIERILRRDFKAEGNGLGELINSVTDKRILQSTRLRIRYIILLS
jgi:hypothetical protein